MKRPRLSLSTRQHAALAGVLTVLLLLLTSGRIGVTWDEPTYFLASERFTSWIGLLGRQPGEALSRETVDRVWAFNHEHPPVDKVASGIVWRVSTFVLDDLTAHRLFNILLFGTAAAFLFLLIAETFGGAAAWAAVAALVCMPRYFFHAHLATLDVPAAGLTVILVSLFWRTKDSPGRRATLWLGLLAGLAVGVRINTLPVLAVLLVWTLLFQRKGYLLARLCSAGVIGTAVFWALWPWLWYDTLSRVRGLFLFAVRNPIPQYYLGNMVMPPPWHYPFVMVFLVVPLAVLMFAGAGMLACFRQRNRRPFAILLLFFLLLPVLIIATGSTKVYDNDRMLMPVFPFLAMFAGAGFAGMLDGATLLLRRLRGFRHGRMAAAAVGIPLLLIPSCLAGLQLHPYLLSYYSEAAGGLAGAHRLGMETTYWSESYLDALPFLNEHAEPGDSIWVLRSSVDPLVYYQLNGKLRGDLAFAGIDPGDTIYRVGEDFRQVEGTMETADFVVVQHRESFLWDVSGSPTEILAWMEGRDPVFRVEREGVPILDIFCNK